MVLPPHLTVLATAEHGGQRCNANHECSVYWWRRNVVAKMVKMHIAAQPARATSPRNLSQAKMHICLRVDCPGVQQYHSKAGNKLITPSISGLSSAHLTHPDQLRVTHTQGSCVMNAPSEGPHGSYSLPPPHLFFNPDPGSHTQILPDQPDPARDQHIQAACWLVLPARMCLHWPLAC